MGKHPYLKCELQKRHSQLLTCRVEVPVNFVKHFECSTKMELLAHVGVHGLSCLGSSDEIWTLLADHFTQGHCSKSAPTMEACSEVCDSVQTESSNSNDIQAYILKAVSYNIPCKWVLALLHVQGMQFYSSESLSKSRKVLRCHTCTLQKGKCVPVRSAHQDACCGTKDVVREAGLNSTRNRWLQVVPQSLKTKISQMFQEETSSDAL